MTSERVAKDVAILVVLYIIGFGVFGWVAGNRMTSIEDRFQSVILIVKTQARFNEELVSTVQELEQRLSKIEGGDKR